MTPPPSTDAAEAPVRLVVTAGPHAGKDHAFDRHDTFLVGRSKDAHFRLSRDDPYFSRRHFLVEINPPRVRVLDLKSRNGIHVNGRRVTEAELADGDELKAGHTVFRVVAPKPPADPPADPPTDSPDRTIPHIPADLVPGYDLGDQLGRGGMGVVYRAVRRSDRAAVAVKTITPAAGAGPRAVERFLREAAILQQLSHPHIVAYHDAGESGWMIYLVMELVEGPTAARILREKGPLPVRAAVRLVCQVLDALAHAHAAGFVHRDVKPSNLLIGRAGKKRTVKLADFGLARAFEMSRLSGLTLQGEVGGTPAFMAPEQVTHYREAKPAADQYSAAATLYALLTGEYIHDLPSNPTAALVHILTEKPIPIRDRNPSLPTELAEVIHRALSREPDDRYPDAAALRSALAAFG